MLPGPSQKPNQEAAHREKEDEHSPQHHDQGRAATTANFIHCNDIRDDKQNKEQKGPEGIVGHGSGVSCCAAGSGLWVVVCVG